MEIETIYGEAKLKQYGNDIRVEFDNGKIITLYDEIIPNRDYTHDINNMIMKVEVEYEFIMEN